LRSNSGRLSSGALMESVNEEAESKHDDHSWVRNIFFHPLRHTKEIITWWDDMKSVLDRF
jgi:hypothetical protein